MKNLKVDPRTDTELHRLHKSDFIDHTPELEIQKYLKQDNHDRTIFLTCGKENLVERGMAPVKKIKKQPNEKGDTT